MKRILLSFICTVILTANAHGQQYCETCGQMTESKWEPGLFNHLSIGATIGFPGGLGIEGVMPINNKFNLRAGISALSGIFIKANFTNNVVEVLKMTDSKTDEAYTEALANSNSTLRITPKVIQMRTVAEYYPIKNSTFHVVGGFALGNNDVLGIKNDVPNGLKFLNRCNEYVQDYNSVFGTNYTPIGVRFGDRILTVDDDGNLEATIKVNAVRPYLGVGWGRSISKHRAWTANFEVGAMYWGKPKVEMKGRGEAPDGSSVSKASKAFVNLSVIPVLELRIAGNIF